MRSLKWTFICTTAAMAFVSTSAMAQVCGDPAAGDCCVANGTPACSDADCCNAVCAVDSFCCTNQWDTICAGEAADLCGALCGGGGGGNPACGDPNTNDCCTASTTPGCSDSTCCNDVCAADAFCCDTQWDQICANEAESLCFKLCGSTCDLGTPTQFEGELCGEDLNGGCNSTPPASEPISVGAIVQGTFWADADIRDTDWYLLSLTEATEVTASIRSSLNCFVAFVDPATCTIIGNVSTGECPGTTSQCFAPGDYYVVALTSVFTGYPCGGPAGNDYTLELSGVPCDATPPANDNCGDAAVATIGANPFDNTFATTEVGDVSCGFGGAPFTKDVWFTFTATADDLVTFETCSGSAPFDTGIELWDNCPFDGGSLVACNDDGAGCTAFASKVVYSMTTGQTVRIRIGGWQGASGATELVISLGGNAACGDPNANDCCVANTTPGCADETCCNNVCAVDAFCCDTQWDQICANQAETLCGTLCLVPCDLDPATQNEVELCGEDLNGGCNSTPPASEPIAVGDTVQGTFWADANTRDTDWYLLSLTEATQVTVEIRSTLNCFTAFVDPAGCTIIGAVSTGECPGTASECLPPGDYYIVALTSVFTGYPCGGVAGNDYSLKVSGIACDASPPANDDCANAATAIVGANPFDNTFATTEVSAPSCGFGGAPFTKDVWFSFTASAAGTYTFETCTGSAPFDTGIEIYNACPNDGGVIVACNDDGTGCANFSSNVQYAMTSGQTVRIRIGGWNGATGATELIISGGGGGGGGGCDSCSTPTVVTVGANPFVNTATGCTFATLGCGSGNSFNTNFYQFTPSATSSYKISTCGTASFDTVIAVETGCGGTVLACNDDFGGCAGFTSEISSVNLTAGTAYIITIGGYSATTVAGTGTLTITNLGGGGGGGVPNDECATATAAVLGVNNFTNVGATGSTPGGCVTVNKDVWYSFTASGNASITISFCAADGGSTTLDTAMKVFDACGGALIACNDDSCGLASKVTFTPTCGTTYKIALGSWSTTASGSGTFTISQTGTCAPPCPADFNGNGSVGADDLAFMLNAWGTAAADLNGDGTTNSADLAALLNSFGPCS